MEYIFFLEKKKTGEELVIKTLMNFSTSETNIANVLTQHGMMEWLSKGSPYMHICAYKHIHIHTHF